MVMATIALDDSTSQMTTGNTDNDGSEWVIVGGTQFYGGSSTYPPFASNRHDNGDSGNYGTLTVTFQGNTPPSTFSQDIYVSIDGAAAYQTWYNDPSPPSVIQWYQSPKLSDSQHTIVITHIAATSVDMMMIEAGANTPLSGQTLIVDDDDPSIVYSGSWARKTGRFHTPPDPSSGQPYGNVTHESASPGASATFTFFGSSISVYSVFDYSHLGSTTVTYLLDSTASTKFYDVTSDSLEYQQGYLQRVNTLLWSSGTISAGEHTLKIELTSTTNGAALVLDYLVYSPSFKTLATKPQDSSQNKQLSSQGLTGDPTAPFSSGVTSGPLGPSSIPGASRTKSQVDASTVKTASDTVSPDGHSDSAMGTVTVTNAVAGFTSLPTTGAQHH
ncbi:hypothetical protein H0H93_009508, partial [Arthromyces matolae]